MARDWITGVKNPWRDLFSPDRKKVRGGTWDYLRENKDYPYYLIQDRFRSPEGKSVRAVKRGEGKILKLGGKKLAVYRDDRGRVKKMSAVCTHMGCLVRWNQADATWDCPCQWLALQPNGQSARRPCGNAAPFGLTQTPGQTIGARPSRSTSANAIFQTLSSRRRLCFAPCQRPSRLYLDPVDRDCQSLFLPPL